MSNIASVIQYAARGIELKNCRACWAPINAPTIERIVKSSIKNKPDHSKMPLKLLFNPALCIIASEYPKTDYKHNTL